MRLNRILALSAVIALAFAATTPAETQFGGLLNKAKKAAKEKVDKKAKEAKNKAENAALGAIGDAAENASVPGATGLSDDESNAYEGAYVLDADRKAFHL